MLPGCSVLELFLPRKVVKVANTSLDVSFHSLVGVGDCKLGRSTCVP